MKIDEKGLIIWFIFFNFSSGNGEHLLSRAFADSPLTSGFESPEHDAQMVDEYQNRSAAIEKAEEDIEYHQKIINQLVCRINRFKPAPMLFSRRMTKLKSRLEKDKLII